MKKLNYLFLLGLLSILTVGLNACSDDDEANGISNPSDLIGTWDPIHAEGYEIYDGEKETWNEDIQAASNNADYSRLVFQENGTFTKYYYYNGWKSSSSGTYQLDGNKIRGHFSDDEETIELTIVSLTPSQLIVEEKASWNGEEYYEKVTFKKVD